MQSIRDQFHTQFYQFWGELRRQVGDQAHDRISMQFTNQFLSQLGNQLLNQVAAHLVVQFRDDHAKY